VILLDTHIWVWWVQGDVRLSEPHHQLIIAHEEIGLGVSAISCWEVAKLVEVGRLSLPCPVGEWLKQAMGYPGVRLLALSPEIAVASTQLPGEFHRDPADQIIVATARVHAIPLLTVDARILAYPHVESSQARKSDENEQDS
jgi:PIN domain nuclease of toxin-antitoxin system